MAIGIRSFGENYHSHELYVVTFFDDVVRTLVTSNHFIVDNWISAIKRLHGHRLVVGLDVEWRPNTIAGVSNPVATLQLCVGRSCLIFQLIHADEIPQSLYDFLADEGNTFVGVGIIGDTNKLYNGYGLVVVNTVELGELATGAYGNRSLQNSGLKALASAVLEKEFEKERWVTLSNWDDRRLSLPQILYACVDAYVSFEIGRVLGAGN